MTYKIYFKNRAVRGINNAFDSYEKARQAVRKLMRKRIKGEDRWDLKGYWDSVSKNPTALTANGYTIKAV